MASNEMLPLVDENGNIVGKETRKVCHGGSMLLHPVVHLHILDANGKLYLQKRSMTKDIQPGKWDTAVGGHIDYGESVETALLRESMEELGLTGIKYKHLFSYVFESKVERELINSFSAVVEEKEIKIDLEEIDEGRFWDIDEIEANLGKGVFTPNFELEFGKLKRTLLKT